jgi:hypothetical protein
MRRRAAATAILVCAIVALAPAAFAMTSGAILRASPYEYFGWGRPPRVTHVMAATGVRAFTLAFVLSDGTCNPKWDGERPLKGGSDQAAIRRIRAAGGDVVASFGGWSGAKLGERCTTPEDLAGAYEKVIDAYRLKAIDIDIEHTEIASAAVRQRVIDALTLVRAHGAPGHRVAISITIGTGLHGPEGPELDLIHRAAASRLRVRVWTIMPFDFGSPVADMGHASITASEGLKRRLMAAFGFSPREAYHRMGISSMNGATDEADETVTLADFRAIRAYAHRHHLARFTFWAANRDRSCGPHDDADSCSGLTQEPLAFTKVIARYHG